LTKRKTMNTISAYRTANDRLNVEVLTEYVHALREAVGLQIDPHTAEVEWDYRDVSDPYGDYPLPANLCFRREYFARSPGSKLWIWFGDLPGVSAKFLWDKHKCHV
jgi:hypothetical protein